MYLFNPIYTNTTVTSTTNIHEQNVNRLPALSLPHPSLSLAFLKKPWEDQGKSGLTLR